MSTNLRSADVYVATKPVPTIEIRKATAYILATVVDPLTIRKVNGYALTTSQDPIDIRRISGYALTDQVKRPSFALSGIVALLAAINKEKSVSLTLDTVSFANPTVNPTTTDYLNTYIKVSAKRASGYQGDYTFNYHRFLLSEAFEGQTLSLPATVGSTIWATLAAINTKYGLKLEQSDIVNGAIANGATGFTLTVAATSIYYQPGTTVVLGTL